MGWNLTEGKTEDVTKENQKEVEVEIPETQVSEENAFEECKDEKNEPEIHFGKMEELVEEIDADIDQIEEEKKIVDGHLERAEAMMEEDLEEAANELENVEEESIDDIFKEKIEETKKEQKAKKSSKNRAARKGKKTIKKRSKKKRVKRR